MLFSLRNKLLNNDAMLSRFRNRVWNAFCVLLDTYHSSCVASKSVRYYEAVSTLLFCVVDKIGLEVVDEDPYTTRERLHELLDDASQFNDIYDFIEAHLEALFDPLVYHMELQVLIYNELGKKP